MKTAITCTTIYFSCGMMQSLHSHWNGSDMSGRMFLWEDSILQGFMLLISSMLRPWHLTLVWKAW